MNEGQKQWGRERALERAREVVCGEREGSYGTPEHSFAIIAAFWNVWGRARGVMAPGKSFNSRDVAVMMGLLKDARLSQDLEHEDSWIDKIGYGACGAESAELTRNAEEEGGYTAT